MGKGKCGHDCGECRQSCLNCDGTFILWVRKKGNNVNVHTFKPYFDVTLGKEVSSKHEINEYCKRNDMVYAGDKELTQQCEQNKRENVMRHERAFERGLTERLMGICS